MPSEKKMGQGPMQAIPTGFSTVYRREFPFVWAAARHLGVPAAALDDAVQDVFLTAYRRWDDLDYEDSPRAWLYGVTRRVAFRYRRTQARVARRRSAMSRSGRSRHEPHAELEGAHDVDAVLAGLDRGRREVFVMSALLDMSGPEIAAELEIPLNTVYSRLRLARRQLERKVARGGAGAWIADARQGGRPPRGQSRRSWAVLLPALQRGASVAAVTGAAAVSGKLIGIGAMVAMVAVVVALVVTGWVGRGDARERTAGQARSGAHEAKGGVSAGGVSAGGVSAGGESAGGASSPVAGTPGDVGIGGGVVAGRPSVAASLGERAGGVTPVDRAGVPSPGSSPPGGTNPRPRREPARAGPDAVAESDAVAEPGSERSPASAEPAAAADASLAAEVAVLDRATAAMRQDQAARALQWLAEHERRFPRGRLVDVRKATRVRVLCALGREAAAREQAAALRREHPDSAVARRVPDSCEKV